MNDSANAVAAESRTHAGPVAAFAALALIWGYNWVVMKLAMLYAGPIDFAALRVGFGVLLLFVGVAPGLWSPGTP